MKRVLGFSVVEVLITLTILMLVLTLSYQSLSTFLGFAVNTRSSFNEKQWESITRIKLKSSFRAMLDYYTVDENGSRTPFFIAEKMKVQYVSSSPMIFSNAPEVLVTLLVKEVSDEFFELLVLECPLKSVLPYRLSFVPVEKNEQCVQIPKSILAENIQFEVEYSEEQGRFQMEGFEAQAGISTYLHLLPAKLSIIFEDKNNERSWLFWTKIENMRKYSHSSNLGSY